MRHESADESKLIDLRQLGAMIDSRSDGTAAGLNAAALPVFGADQLNRVPPQLVAPALRPPPVQPPPSVSVPRQGVDTTVLLVMIGTLTLAVLALAVYIVVSTPAPAPVIVESAASGIPTLTDDEAPKMERRVESEAAAARAVELPAPAVEAPVPIESANPETKPNRSRRRGTRATRGTPSASAPTTPPSKPNRQSSSQRNRSASDLPAECILDPKGCGLGGATPPASKPQVKQDPPSEDLPVKLAPAAIRNAMAKVKADAKSCRAKFGGKPGEKVLVKLSIAGATGRVTKAAPMPPHAGTALGSCVAAALKHARFDRFGASVQGVQYGVRL